MLTVTLVCIGRLKGGSELELASRYLERARQVGRGLGLAVELKELAESRARRPADRKHEEAGEIRAALGDRRGELVVFDEQGRPLDSASFAALIGETRETSSPIAFVIGGPDGLDPALRAEAAHVVALGAMTWPHQIVRILAAEQIYRAMTILSGHPYHRA